MNVRPRSSKPLKRSGLTFAQYFMYFLGYGWGYYGDALCDNALKTIIIYGLTPTLWKLRVKMLINGLPHCLSEIDTLNVRNCQELVTHPFTIFFLGGGKYILCLI